MEASEGVVTKRIDLALLEAKEAGSRTVRGALSACIAVILGCAAWFALLGAAVFILVSGMPARLALFGGINAGVAAVLAGLAARQTRPGVVALGAPTSTELFSLHHRMAEG